MNKKYFFRSLLFFFVFDILIQFPIFSQTEADSKLPLKEVWGYVMIGEEKSFSNDYPVTDIGYFVSAINNYSDFPEVPNRYEKFPDYKGRVHLVSSVDSTAQTHLLLDPKLPLRNKIIKQLVAQAKDYDGVQIDWELVLKNDDENFWNFLKQLKKKLKGKMLTVAIPARLKTLEKDAYDYFTLSKIVDKIIVMAYDEHWSTSAPGPIASVAWCKRIADYAKTVIPEEKLVMGCHFYARAWNNEDVGRKAYRMYKIDGLIKDNKVSIFNKSADGDLSFYFEKKTRVTVFYDTIDSAIARCKMYADSGIERLSFWRIGQEIPEFWDKIEIAD
ncbi:glycosyl hydrolase family 18 protein [Treponema sp. UBA3813]|uniref:glycosyl hydrolase family 18 protein n=1 Tax=Treponema sp. UBA3813 TaxID=1947715 RepID=UPI0025CD645C|nr:glycosyl hydrolase family 18 protein [Treponema sp. UBA3813]